MEANMSGILYLVGTPIGNLGDFSPRAAQTLAEVDFIAAEDTRVSVKLLNHFEIKKPMISYFEHNTRQRGEEIVTRLEAGESCALVTDAGMPAISDPGEDLVSLCALHNILVVVVPGPCAAVSALALSGLETGRFCFEGFLCVNKKSRLNHLEAVKNDERTLIFYEAPHKLRATLHDMLNVFGDRSIALVREMTKVHEEVVRTTLNEAVEFYAENTPKGEFVLVIKGKPMPTPVEKSEADGLTEDDVFKFGEELVSKYINQGMTHPEAVKLAAKETGIRRSELYKRTTGDTN
jgi:16S rRNA (cytidine1402-2'-O)-methyltransferase